MFSWKISTGLKLPGKLVEKNRIRPERLNNGVASNRIAGELKNEM